MAKNKPDRRDFLKYSAAVAAGTVAAGVYLTTGKSGKMPEKVIIDGDGGGDDMQLAAVLLAHPGQVQVVGATAVFGNVPQPLAFKNTRNIMHFLHADDVPVYPGATHATGTAPQERDMAHGEDGLGGVVLAESPVPRIEGKTAVDFILEQLKNNPSHTITITATGPLTNIAQAIQKDPQTMSKVKQIVVMGGATEDMPARDMPLRRGNITSHAEFNFFTAPEDARIVMESGLPVTLFPMNCTHQLTLTSQRQSAIRDAFRNDPPVRDALIKMMTAPAELDRRKFNLDPVMHDVHTALYLVNPDLYHISAPGRVTVSTDPNEDFGTTRKGRTEFTPQNGTVRVATGFADPVKGPDQAFAIFLQSIQKCITPGRQMQVG